MELKSNSFIVGFVVAIVIIWAYFQYLKNTDIEIGISAGIPYAHVEERPTVAVAAKTETFAPANLLNRMSDTSASDPAQSTSVVNSNHHSGLPQFTKSMHMRYASDTS